MRFNRAEQRLLSLRPEPIGVSPADQVTIKLRQAMRLRMFVQRRGHEMSGKAHALVDRALGAIEADVRELER